MAFERQVAVVPQTIRIVEVTLRYPHPQSGIPPRALYDVEVQYNNGEIRTLSGDLSPHLSTAQITGLMDFMQDMYIKAVQEILPL